jgi:hypothetical protein
MRDRTPAVQRHRHGFSVLELLLGVVIFSFAMIPMLSLSMSSTRGAFSITKHMMGTQIAQSLLDRYMAMPFDQARTTLTTGVKGEVVKDPELLKILEMPAIASAKSKIHDDFLRAFKGFVYEAGISDGTGPDAGQAYLVRVKVAWALDEAPSRMDQQMTVAAIRYRDDR